MRPREIHWKTYHADGSLTMHAERWEPMFPDRVFYGAATFGGRPKRWAVTLSPPDTP